MYFRFNDGFFSAIALQKYSSKYNPFLNGGYGIG
jgi:hypothetical protein